MASAASAGAERANIIDLLGMTVPPERKSSRRAGEGSAEFLPAATRSQPD
jgi:hypothetical protein